MLKNKVKNMWSTSKRKIYFGVKNNITVTHIATTILTIVAICVYIFKSDRAPWYEYVDEGLIISFVVIIVSTVIASAIKSVVERLCEDAAKTGMCSNIIKKYPRTVMVRYNNLEFPVECIYMKTRCETLSISIEDDADKYYQLPSKVEENFEELMKAHNASKVYNNICIRLDDVVVEGNHILLKTSRTHYYDSLVTNRVGDYLLNSGTTVREMYEPGPYIKPLKLSKMSNHIGFNGFVITKDGKIPFVLRKSNVSTAKRMYGTGVSASLKAEYALNENLSMDNDSLGKAIIAELCDELNLERDVVNLEKAADSVFALYRDLMECGKPQFLFSIYLHSIDSDELKECIEKKLNKSDMKRDGNRVRFFTLEQLQNAKLESNYIMVGEEKLDMFPTTVASIAMFNKYMGKEM